MSETPTIGEFASLKSRKAVVTGSSSGIGRAIALELARAGADVVIHCAKSRDRAESVAAEVEGVGRQAIVIQHDLEEGDFDQFVSQCWETLGQVDVWVNNAGVDLLTGEGPTLPYEEKLRKLLSIDVTGSVLLSRKVGARMQEAGQGVILNIGWDQADRGMEGDSGELFTTSKNAVMGFTRSLAVSLAPQVRVNCIAPGWIKTAWGEQTGEVWQNRVLVETPLRRWGTPEDIAKLARFLVSDDAAYLTGQVINANGGAVR